MIDPIEISLTHSMNSVTVYKNKCLWVCVQLTLSFLKIYNKGKVYSHTHTLSHKTKQTIQFHLVKSQGLLSTVFCVVCENNSRLCFEIYVSSTYRIDLFK